MPRKKKEDAPRPSSPAYMTTYGDMMTLLLCFFVMLVSISTVEIEKFREAAASLKGALSILPYQTKTKPQPLIRRISRGIKKKSTKRARAISKLRMIIREKKLEKIVKVREDTGGIHITIGDPALFKTGKADIKPDFIPILESIVDIIMIGDNIIRIEGHTDNIPIYNEQFRDNWDLSIARALSVIRYIRSREQIDPIRLRPVGCGEYHPIDTNDTLEGRAKNRRVEVYIDFEEKSGVGI